MWSISPQNIPDRDIRADHLRTLERAVEESAEFDVRRPEVYAALEYLERRSSRRLGFTVFRQALAAGRRPDLIRGLTLIKAHLGITR
jgi:hypothetical protein